MTSNEKLKKQANRNTKVTFLFLSCICAAGSSIAIDLESIYAEHAKYCMTQLNTEEQNFLNGYLMQKLRRSAFGMLSKKRVKNLMPSFSRIKFRMKNIDEHWLALRHFQMRDSLIVFRKRQTVRLRDIASLAPKISEAGTLCRPRRAIYQSVHKHPRRIN